MMNSTCSVVTVVNALKKYFEQFSSTILKSNILNYTEKSWCNISFETIFTQKLFVNFTNNDKKEHWIKHLINTFL